jgi:hypothetical protein
MDEISELEGRIEKLERERYRITVIALPSEDSDEAEGKDITRDDKDYLFGKVSMLEKNLKKVVQHISDKQEEQKQNQMAWRTRVANPHIQLSPPHQNSGKFILELVSVLLFVVVIYVVVNKLKGVKEGGNKGNVGGDKSE